MAYSHRYDLIKENDDVKEGGNVKDDIQHTIPPPTTTAWWKLLLCNLAAAFVGAGVMFLLSHNFRVSRSATGVATATNASVTSPTTDLAIPTASVSHVEAGVKSQNSLTGIILDCGGNPEEARAKGCVYDVMMQDWVPEPCYDSVLTEKYLAEGNYTWYRTGNGNETMTLEEMRKGEHGGAFMSTAYHKAHCVFSWMKIIRALRNDRGISQELLSYDHVMHCAMGALKASSDDTGLGVRAPTNYAKCALYGTWLKDPIPDKHNSTQR